MRLLLRQGHLLPAWHVFLRNVGDIFLVGVAEIALAFFFLYFFCGSCHLRDVSINSFYFFFLGAAAAGIAQIRFTFGSGQTSRMPSVKETS